MRVVVTRFLIASSSKLDGQLAADVEEVVELEDLHREPLVDAAQLVRR